MTQNDFLASFFNLHPLIIVFIIWLWGFGSLIIVGLRTQSIRSVILKTPGIMIGDFFLIPLAGFLIALGYQRVESPMPQTSSSWWSLTTLVVALALAILSRNRFKLTSIWWLPHVLFYWFMAYIIITFLSKMLWQLLNKGNAELWFIWAIILIAVTTHQTLGILWPKKFPTI